MYRTLYLLVQVVIFRIEECLFAYLMLYILCVQVSVEVKNKGDVAGDDAVLLFGTDVIRRVTPRYKLLKGFDKVSLQPGEVTKVCTASGKVTHDLDY